MAMSHYVYIHFTKDELKPFYIGKGIGNRRNKTNSRNRWWKFVVAKHGFVSDILKEFDTNEDALVYEVETIKFFREEGFNLVNIPDGGEGSSGMLASEETKRKIGEHSRRFPRGQAKPKYKIVATNLDTGATIEMIGKQAIVTSGFQPRNVYKCCCGLQNKHLGHTFTKFELQ